MTSLLLSRQDLLNIRFAISPIWEVNAAVRALLHGGQSVLVNSWRRASAPQLQNLQLGRLALLNPARGYTPDFLCPSPTGLKSDLSDSLAAIAETPRDLMLEEIQRTADMSPDPRVSGHLTRLAKERRLADMLADDMQRVWTTFVEPRWSEIHETLANDVAYRMQKQVDLGLSGLLSDLESSIAVADGRLILNDRSDTERELGGEGVLLVPSLFGSASPTVIVEPPWQPIIFYPTRNSTLLLGSETDRNKSLEKLLGRTRAALLMATVRPATTTGLAEAFHLSNANVSVHLKVLRDAGLVRARRDGLFVYYQCTALGLNLATGLDEL